MDTTFAPVEKVDKKELAAEIKSISDSPVMSGLLQSARGMLVILDEHRQIIALNNSFLDKLGMDDSGLALGLRLGEALGCIHAHEGPGHTCGSTRFCPSCGAAIAMVTSLSNNCPDERICALSAHRKGQPIELSLLIRSEPIQVKGKRFLLMFIQDITQQQQWAALERTFFHDINNMLGILAGASERLVAEQPSELSEAICEASDRLIKEVAIQQYLTSNNEQSYQPQWAEVTLKRILDNLQTFFATHVAAQGKQIEFPDTPPERSVKTDSSLVSRVLSNMVLNALEATEDGGQIRVGAESQEGRVSFTVWNRQEIPPEAVMRIFQRNFSTKNEAGRGTGTFSMKLFGEKILGGLVDFSTSAADGTTFRLTLHA